MRTLIGVDGCKRGWLCVAKRAGRFEAWIAPDITSVVKRAGARSLIGIDVPIGFARSTGRECDTAARALLGTRACTVFSPPVRDALAARTHQQACRINRKMRGRGISIQAFHLYPKLREVDSLLRSHRRLRHRLFEVHPEVSFALWRGRPMQHGKKSARGRRARMRLIEKTWPNLIARLRDDLGRGGYVTDDLLDAIAVLWSTIRFAQRSHESFPDKPEFDTRALPMRIVG